MRFDRIRSHRFGGLVDLDTGPEALPDLVVFAGPNEAGKSTFFRLLTSLLYGFLPANREQNRDAPWSGDEADGMALVRMDEGEVLEIHRKLRSTPWGRLTTDGHEHDIRNRPLDTLERLPRTVFRQVFALTLAEVAGLEMGSWAEVQDRLVNAMGARDLIAPRDAANQLEEEAGSLWRPNRRGKQAVRLLGERIRDAERARDDARERDREIRELDQKNRTERRQLSEAKKERAAIQLTEERVSRLLPVHRQLQRIEQLNKEAGEPGAMEGLPPDPKERLSGLREQEAVLAMRVQELDALAAGIAENERRASSICEDLLGRVWSAEDRSLLRRISAAAVRQRTRAYLEARDARRIAEAGTAAPEPVTGAVRGINLDRRTAFFGAAGLIGLSVGLAAGVTWLTIAGSLSLIAAIVHTARHRGRPPLEDIDGPIDMTALADAERSALDAVHASMAGMQILPAIASAPTLELPGLLQRLQELDRDLQAQAALATEAAPATVDEVPAPPESQLDLGFSPTRPHGFGGATDSAGGASQTASMLGAARGVANKDRHEAESARLTLEKRLALLGEGDPDKGVHVAMSRMAAARTARELVADLDRAHVDLDSLRAEIADAISAAESWTTEANGLSRLRRQRVELTQRIEALGRSLERDEQTMARLRDLPAADELEGEVLVLVEERKRLARTRDRKILLAKLIRAADQQFRSERQPRVLRRAGEYLAQITDHRYSEILTAEDGDRDVFRLRGNGHPHAVPLDQGVSTGTREQAYLALRLAALDELDDGGERFPIFIDEVFVNWDAARRHRGIELMGTLAGRRQVFVFTCHTEVADSLERIGAQVVALESGRLRSLEGAW